MIMSSSEEHSDDDHLFDEDSASSDEDSLNDSESQDDEDSNLSESDAASDSGNSDSESSDNSDSDNLDQGEADDDVYIEGIAFLLQLSEITRVIENNDLDAMRGLIDRGLDVKKCYAISLHCAASRGALEMAQLLLDAGVDPEIVGPLGLTALNTAIQIEDTSKRWAMVRLLINAGVNVKNDKHLRESYMHQAVYSDDVELLKFLSDVGADVNRFNSKGRTPILAALKGNQRLEMIKQLVNIGADVNIKDKDGYSCLHWVPFYHSDRCELMKIFLEAGADLNCISTIEGGTPFAMAASMGDCELLEKMIDAGAVVDPCKTMDNSPLCLAVMHRHKDAVKFLIEHGADVNLKCARGKFDILTYAVIPMKDSTNEDDYIEVLKMILVYSEYNRRSDLEKSAVLRTLLRGGTIRALHLFIQNGTQFENCGVRYLLHHATNNSRTEILEHLLRTYQNDIDEYDDDGYTALMLAILEENVECVKLLLEWGADVEKPVTSIENGVTISPLCAAFIKKNVQIVNLLISAGAVADPNHPNNDEYLIDTTKYNKINNCLAAQAILHDDEALLPIEPQQISLKIKYSNKFVKKCLAELEILRNHSLYGSVTVYDFLRGADITGVVGNCRVTGKFESLNDTENFPIYGEQINVCYSMACVKRSVMDKAVQGLAKILGVRFRTCYSILHNIMLHMQMKDLRNLCKI